MNTYQFIGYLNPPDILTFKDYKIHARELAGLDKLFSGKIDVSIHENNILIRLKTDYNFDEDLETLKNSIEYFCKGLVNAGNYYYGTAVDMIIHTGGNTSKQPYTFPPKLRFLSNVERPLSPDELTSTIAKQPMLHRAIGQAIDAIRNPMDTGFHCYRAIEAIRQSYLDEGQEDNDKARKNSWLEMSKTLRVERSYYDVIKLNADITRHGNIQSLSGKIIEDIMTRTWKIIDRYIIYIQQGENKLSDSIELLK